MNKKIIAISLLSIFTLLNIGVNTVNAFEYGGFGLRPADIDNDTPRKGESGFAYELTSGSTKKDGLMVINNTKLKKTFIVYVADSVPSTDGGFACRQFSEDKKQVGSWIKLDKNEVEVNSGSNEVIPFTITMPPSVDSGEHNGCFLIQEKKAEASKDDKKKNGIQLSIRTGVRVAITVPGELIKKLAIKNFDFSKKIIKEKKNNKEVKKEVIIFNASAVNSGNVSIDADVKVKVSNMFGIPHKTLGGKFSVLRDDTSVWNFQLPQPFWGGYYFAKLNVEYDSTVKASDQKIKNSKDSKAIVKLASDKTISFFTFPTIYGLISEIAILIFIIFCLYLLSVWKQRMNWIKTWKDYTVSRSTNIKVLAEKYDVSWKLLANVNKIKPPYIVTTKDKLKVPSDTEEDYNEDGKNNSILSKIKNYFSQTSKKTKKKK